MENIPEQKRTIAAHGFLSLLMRLRRVLLQDCAFLQKQQPEHMLFKHDIFKTDAYQAYASAVLDRVRKIQPPMDVQFQQVMPQLHSKMDTMSEVLDTGMKDIQSTLRATVDQNLNEFRQDMLPTLSDIGKIQTKQATHQKLLLTHLGLLAQGLQLITDGTFETRLRLPSGIAGENGESSGTTINPSELLEQVARLTEDFPETGQPLGNAPAAGSSSNPLPTPSSHPNAPAPVTSGVFVLEATHATVQALWKEWKEGVFGRLPVKTMITKGWKKSEAQRKLYARRRVVIDEVERLADARTEPGSAIVKAMDTYMSQKKLSMTKLQDLIKQRSVDGKTIAFWMDE